jgi:hypothetical protein
MVGDNSKWNKFPFLPNCQISSDFQLEIPEQIPISIIKGFKPFGENIIKSLKFYLHKIFMNINLYDLTCIKKFKVPLQVANMTWFNDIQRKDLNSNLNLNQHTL